MTDVKLAKSDLHSELFEVVDPPKDQKDRIKLATRLRNSAKREGAKVTIAQRGESIFVAASPAAEKALPQGAGRGRKGLKITELMKDAS